jgi:hypothetical protein
MTKIYNCKIALDVTATLWEKHGDHPYVLRVPDHVNIEGVDKESLGLIKNTAFGPGTYIIEVGGNIFPVDKAYFETYYTIVSEIDTEKTETSEEPPTEEGKE